jgi:hypothetical protein
VPSLVAYTTEMGTAEGWERVTVKTASVNPVCPSATVTSLIESDGGPITSA